MCQAAEQNWQLGSAHDLWKQQQYCNIIDNGHAWIEESCDTHTCLMHSRCHSPSNKSREIQCRIHIINAPSCIVEKIVLPYVLLPGLCQPRQLEDRGTCDTFCYCHRCDSRCYLQFSMSSRPWQGPSVHVCHIQSYTFDSSDKNVEKSTLNGWHQTKIFGTEIPWITTIILLDQTVYLLLYLLMKRLHYLHMRKMLYMLHFHHIQTESSKWGNVSLLLEIEIIKRPQVSCWQWTAVGSHFLCTFR